MDGGEEKSSPPASWDKRRPVATPEMVRHAVRTTMARNLPEIEECNAHAKRMSIVGRGPTLEDTFREIKGYVAAVNHAHDWLINRGARVHACGLIDPVPWLADQITPKKGVTYFLASMCHALVYDKLKGENIVVWHASQGEEGFPITDLIRPTSILVPGGNSMALRWIDLGYVLGFRHFDFYGFDCSNRGERHHVDDHDVLSHPGSAELFGYITHPGWLAQVNDLFLRMEFFTRKKELDPIEITLHGDGLVQHLLKEKIGSTTWRSR